MYTIPVSFWLQNLCNGITLIILARSVSDRFIKNKTNISWHTVKRLFLVDDVVKKHSSKHRLRIKTSSAYQNGGPNGEGCCYGKVSRHHPHYCRRSTLLLWHRRLRNSAFLDRLRVFWDLDRYLGKFLRDASVVSFLHHKLYLLHIAGIIFVQDGIIFV